MKQGWEIKKLGDIANIRSGKSIDASLISDDSSRYPCFGGNGIRGYVENYRYDGCYPIIGRVGALCGNVHLAKGKFNATEHALIVETKRNDINVEWLTYNLISLKLRDVAKGVAQPVIAASEVSKIAISIPPIAEQEKIVAELDCLSGIIEKKKQQLKELDNLAQSIFYEMFGDPVENDKGWEKKRLDEIGKVITGNTPSTKDESNYSSADYCFVKPSDIAKDSISYISNTEFYVSEKAYINSRQLPKGSVLTTCIGIIGKVGILQKDATCNQQINAIIPNKDIDAKFLAHVLFMIRDVLTDVANAPIVPIINKKEFSSVSIPVPLFSLQQDFASKIQSIEKQKELIAQSIKETETLFNSRMDYYFN